MSRSLKLLMIIYGTTIGVSKGETRSLDNGSYILQVLKSEGQDLAEPWLGQSSILA